MNTNTQSAAAAFTAYCTAIEDYATLTAEFRRRNDAAKKILDAIRNRIAQNRAADTAQLEALTKKLNDPSREDILKRMDEFEAARLKSIEYSPTEAERAAFESEANAARDALDALRQHGRTVKAAKDKAKDAVDELSAIYAKADMTLFPRWIDGTVTAYNRMCGEG